MKAAGRAPKPCNRPPSTPPMPRLKGHLPSFGFFARCLSRVRENIREASKLRGAVPECTRRCLDPQAAGASVTQCSLAVAARASVSSEVHLTSLTSLPQRCAESTKTGNSGARSLRSHTASQAKQGSQGPTAATATHRVPVLTCGRAPAKTLCCSIDTAPGKPGPVNSSRTLTAKP